MPPTILVYGAGCVGAWLGGLLSAAGLPVVLLGRPRLRDAIAAHGLTARTLDGRVVHTQPRVATALAEVGPVELALVTVKGPDTAAAGRALAEVLPPGAPVVSFQNGLRNPDRLRAALPGYPVVPGMVSFNLLWQEPATFQQATSGPVALQAGAPPVLVDALRAAGLAVHLAEDMQAVQWAKLLLNLNNAINALSGLPLRDELADRGYRRVLAAAMDEAWTALRAAGIQPAAVGRLRPALAPRILPLPDALFRLLAAPMIRVDPAARSSMADDLARGRPTEVEDINGEVVALGAAHDVPTPLNARLVALVHAAEAAAAGSPRLAASALWP